MHLRNVKVSFAEKLKIRKKKKIMLFLQDFETNHKNKSSTDTNEQSERLFENREIINTKKWVV